MAAYFTVNTTMLNRPRNYTTPRDLTETAGFLPAQGSWRSRCASWEREVTPSFVNTLRRWKSTVRGLTNSWLATSRLDIPAATSL